MTTLTDRDWLRILSQVGVRPTTAAEWAAPFADEIQPDMFSAGMEDMRSFLAQALHECSMLERLEENLNYSAERLCEVWPARFPNIAAAAPYARNPQALANKVYAGRMGNVQPDDPWRFRGRGLLMHTGRAGYEDISRLCGLDFDVLPELLEQPHYALIAARGWWEDKIQDGFLSDQAKIRRRVNGGLIGAEHCAGLFMRLNEVLA